MNYKFSARKGQSAIEYLMTYGWMLLVVAIVGGAVITTVQNNQNSCQEEIIGMEASQQGFGVSQIGVTSSGLQVEFHNMQQESVTVQSVNVTYEGNDTVVDSNTGLSVNVGFDQKKSVTLSGITSSEQCSTYDVTVGYQKGTITDTLTGQLKAKMA